MIILNSSRLLKVAYLGKCAWAGGEGGGGREGVLEQVFCNITGTL